MISPKLEKKLNEQIQKEFYSAYLYLSMEAYFAQKNLNGFAHWFQVQAQEERDHAMLIYNYILKVGGTVVLGTIEAPPVTYESIQALLKQTYEHEQFVTSSIYDIVDVAVSERDYKTNSFLQWFVNEQVEEEDNALTNVNKFDMVKDDGKGILMLDAELAARVYTPALSTQGAGPQA